MINSHCKADTFQKYEVAKEWNIIRILCRAKSLKEVNRSLRNLNEKYL